MDIFVDADACPVKQEVRRVAHRYGLKVTFVANSWMRIPDEPGVTLEVVGREADAADTWIVEHVQSLDIVITADVPLAYQCVQKDARVIGPTGKQFTEDDIGETLAMRDLMTELRASGEMTGGSPPQDQRDRSRFLQELDKVIQAIRRKNR